MILELIGMMRVLGHMSHSPKLFSSFGVAPNRIYWRAELSISVGFRLQLGFIGLRLWLVLGIKVRSEVRVKFRHTSASENKRRGRNVRSSRFTAIETSGD